MKILQKVEEKTPFENNEKDGDNGEAKIRAALKIWTPGTIPSTMREGKMIPRKPIH